MFDDYRPDAKPVNGIPLGNGNLMYTVSHDAVSGKHSARFEAYTSFNMPREISYSNIDAALDPTLAAAVARQGAATGNPAGITSDRTLAFVYGPEHQRTKQTVTLSNNAPTTLNPGTTWYLNGEDGQSLTYEKEIKTITVNGANGPVKTQVTEHKHYLHVGGISVGMYIQREGSMVGTASTAAPLPAVANYSCPAGYTASADQKTCSQTITTTPNVSFACSPSLGTLNNRDCVLAVTETIAATGSNFTVCPTGAGLTSVLSGTNCNMKSTVATIMIGTGRAAVTGCPAGYTLTILGSGRGSTTTCLKTYTVPATAATFTCPSTAASPSPNIAYTLAGTSCTRTIPVTSAASAIYTCPNPSTQSLVGTGLATTCQSTLTSAAAIAYRCPAGYALQSASCVASTLNASNLNLAPATIRYFHTDHLGSVTAITDETGTVVERLAYDAWGKRRFTNGTADVNDTVVGLTTDRGYTEHEMLDELGIIHMNGRVYDPYIGRFMSADPFIQAPYELQSHNRYSYVMNNPLLYTDPSGFWSWKAFAIIVVVIVATVVTMGAAAYMIAGAGVFAGGFTAGLAAAGAMYGGMGAIMIGAAAGFVGSFLGAALNGANFEQSLKAGVIGGITGAAMAWAGGVGGADGSNTAGRYLAHAAVGCGSAVASGGGASGCGRGAAAAVVGHAITNGSSGWNNPAARFAAATVSGGVTSRIMGGSFANGAQTAAYGYLFNSVLHDVESGAGYGGRSDRQVIWKDNWLYVIYSGSTW